MPKHVLNVVSVDAPADAQISVGSQPFDKDRLASLRDQHRDSYRHILAFIWDDEARTEEHAELRQGLIRLRGVDDAIVLSRPSKMQRSYRDEPASK